MLRHLSNKTHLRSKLNQFKKSVKKARAVIPTEKSTAGIGGSRTGTALPANQIEVLSLSAAISLTKEFT